MEKVKLILTFLGIGITFGVLITVFLVFFIGAKPNHIEVLGVGFEIPTSTPLDLIVPVQQDTQQPIVTQQPSATQPADTQQPSATQPADTQQLSATENPNLIHNEPVSPQILAKIVGGDASHWTQRGPVVWVYSDKDHNIVIHHPGDNMLLTYWAGFGNPQNADDCKIIIPKADNMANYVKCPPGTKAKIVADQVGLHLIDYTGYFP